MPIMGGFSGKLHLIYFYDLLSTLLSLSLGLFFFILPFQFYPIPSTTAGFVLLIFISVSSSLGFGQRSPFVRRLNKYQLYPATI